MKTIVFIGTQKSGSSREAIKEAEKLGYYTVLFTDRPTFIKKRSEFPDVHLMIQCNLSDVKELKENIKVLKINALIICAIVSFVETHGQTASLLSEEFGLYHFSKQVIENMENKILSRKILKNSPYCPYFFTVNQKTSINVDEIKSKLPLIIKVPYSTGSKDVFRVDTFKDFVHQLKMVVERYPNQSILVEEYIKGTQYLVETISYMNELHIIAIIEQQITFGERFIITGYKIVLNPSPDFLNLLTKAVENIVKAHGMETGACHLEMRYINNEWKLIEINPRISGGGMNSLVQIAFGINLVKETLKMAMGYPFDISSKCHNHTFAHYVIVSEKGILGKVTGRNKALGCEGVKEVYIKPRKGSLLIPPQSMGNRYAYVIATGKNEQEAEFNAKNASSQIKFNLLPQVENKDEIE